MAATLDTISNQLRMFQAAQKNLSHDISQIKSHLAKSVGLQKHKQVIDDLQEVEDDETALEEGRKKDEQHKDLIGVLKSLEKTFKSIVPKAFGGNKPALGGLAGLLGAIFGGTAGVVGLGVTNFLTKIAKIPGVAKLTSIFGKLGKFIGQFAGGVGKFLGIITGPLGKLLRFFKYVFAPVTIVLSIIDTLRGALYGYKKEGILGAITGGLAGLLDFFSFGLFPFKEVFELLTDTSKNFIKAVKLIFEGKFLEAFQVWQDNITNAVGGLLELLKNGVGNLIANIADWLGFDSWANDFREALKSYNLQDSIKEWMTQLNNWLIDHVGSTIVKIAKALGLVDDGPSEDLSKFNVTALEATDLSNRSVGDYGYNERSYTELGRKLQDESFKKQLTNETEAKSLLEYFGPINMRLLTLSKFLSSEKASEMKKAEPDKFNVIEKEYADLSRFQRQVIVPTSQYIQQNSPVKDLRKYGGIPTLPEIQKIPQRIDNSLSPSTIIPSNKGILTVDPATIIPSNKGILAVDPATIIPSNKGILAAEYIDRRAIEQKTPFPAIVSSPQLNQVNVMGPPAKPEKIYAPPALRNNEPSIKTVMDVVMRGYALP